ncbi:hypothetical protein I656_02906 [Geobacillus sp. WSUCF1]|nr:hypothetical protein I656_02906 [Geobacillus sp. WSUCF1]
MEKFTPPLIYEDFLKFFSTMFDKFFCFFIWLNCMIVNSPPLA